MLLSKLAGPLIKVAITLAKGILVTSGITAGTSAVVAGIQIKIHGSGTTILIISSKEMNDVMKIVQSLEDSSFLLKGVTKTIRNETKEQKGGFSSMLLCTLRASLLLYMLALKIIKDGSGNKKGKGAIAKRQGRGIVRAGYGNEIDF